ncbi:MAG: YggS family pyridoxal phosphate-dependent enzyme [Acholeplasmataceae bacterium]|jgi:pyridoxal phosphate enzyme (YggS family)|nr:YggS family pyridoxal phosphate-dependent enzyme [Acholeplasmataceae bacterium]
MSNLKLNVEKLKQEIKDYPVTVVCASKYLTVEQMRKLYDLGIHHFGENRADELLKKQQQLTDLAIKWHFIGSLQSNKVKSIINRIDYLHSLDRLKLVKTIEKYRIEPLSCFVQLNFTKEITKSGLDERYLEDFLKKVKNYDKINLIGLMAMGKLGNHQETDYIFKRVKLLAKYYDLKELSIGMSDDYLIALENGATFIRIGRVFVK